MNEPIFNYVYHLIWPCTTAIRQQWFPPGVTNYMVFNFNVRIAPENIASYSLSPNLLYSVPVPTPFQGLCIDRCFSSAGHTELESIHLKITC